MTARIDTTWIGASIRISIRNLRTVLTTAIEGGSNYWLHQPNFRSIEVRRDAENDVTVVRFVGTGEIAEPSDQGKQYDIQENEIAAAFGKVANGDVKINDELRRQIASLPSVEMDIDAGAADALLQIAAFGEIVYG
jgi:hypothetical protein